MDNPSTSYQQESPSTTIEREEELKVVPKRETQKTTESSDFKLKLKLPGMSALQKGFISNIFEEAIYEHKPLSIPKCHWAYRLEPTSIQVDENHRDFLFIVPYCFAQWSSP